MTIWICAYLAVGALAGANFLRHEPWHVLLLGTIVHALLWPAFAVWCLVRLHTADP